MRKSKLKSLQNNFSILTLDDDPIMTSTLQAFFQRSGYHVDVEHEPYRAIERIRQGQYDILLLDFLMTPICGDQVVAEIRKFNKELFIILLTGHKSVAPPIKTIRELDIQGYYEKSDRFDQLELLVESCVKSILQMRTIQNYQNGLSSIIDSLPQIYHLQSLEHIMDSILGTAVSLLGVGSGALEIDSSAFETPNSAISGPVPMTRTTGQADTPPALRELLAQNAFEASGIIHRDSWAMCAIQNAQGEIAGLLSAAMPAPPKEDQVQLLQVFSRQITAALNNVFLHSVVSRKNEELTQAYSKLRDSYMEIINALRLLVDARDIYTCGHSDRVSRYCVLIARAMGKDEAYCERLRIAGLFHDIGKVGVPDDILLKKGRLTDEEFEKIRLHSADGARILSAISMFRDIVPIVRAHHERIDGRGYPDGLCGGAIPLEARIIAVADSYDAMTSNRSYRGALTVEAALQQLREGCSTQFDPDVVKAFLSIEDGAVYHLSQ